jgi:hypothetical protein
MKDFEHRLARELNAVRDEYVESFRAQLPATRGRVLERTRRRTLTLFSVGAVAAALAVLLFALVVQSLAPTEEPGPSVSLVESPTRQERINCMDQLPFVPRWVPEGLTSEPVSSTGYGTPWIYEGSGSDRSIHVAMWSGVDAFDGAATRVSLLGPRHARLGMSAGRPVAIALVEGCGLYFEGSESVTELELRKFLENLVLRTEVSDSQYFTENSGWALWPERAPSASMQRCMNEVATTPDDMARRFLRSELDWTSMSLESSLENEGVAHVTAWRKQGSTSVGRPLNVLLEAVVGDSCWVVTHVDGGSRGNHGISVNRKNVALGFEMLGAQRAVITLYGGDGVETEVSTLKADAKFTIPAPMTEPGAYLIRLLDAQDNVIGAYGNPLPAGDFAAG